MHTLLSLFQTLLLVLGALRMLNVLIKSLTSFRLELKFTYGDTLVARIIQVIKYYPCISPFWVSYGIVRSSLYTPSEKASMVALEFLMAFVSIIILFPLRVLGMPDCVESWVGVFVYAPLRGKFGEIEFSERVMSVLRESDEGDEKGFSTNEI
jgi:hypothetical protein